MLASFFFIYTLFFLISDVVYSQINSTDITGTVFIYGQKSLANIGLGLNGDQFTTITSSDGKFIFYDVPSGMFYLYNVKIFTD